MKLEKERVEFSELSKRSIEHLLCPETEKRNTLMEGARDRKVGFFTAVSPGNPRVKWGPS